MNFMEHDSKEEKERQRKNHTKIPQFKFETIQGAQDIWSHNPKEAGNQGPSAIES